MTINLTAERLNRGLSLNGAAVLIGVNRKALKALEDGESCRPENAKRIADFYGCKVTDLLPLPDEPKAAA